MANQFSNGYALLIAVDDNAVSDYVLPNVKKDVEALYRVLTHSEHCAYPKENVMVLGGFGSTRQNILDGLEWLQKQVQQDTSGHATAVVYYTGHGWRDEKAESDQFLFIPYDMRQGKLRSSALRAEDFTEAISDVQPQRLLVVLDCCHAAGMGVKSVGEIPMGYSGASFKPEVLMTGEKDILATGAKGLEQLTKGRGRAVLSSSTGDQSSYIRKDGKMSVFTYHLLEALTGHAQPVEGDNEVLVSDVMGHVYRHVPKSVKDDWKEVQVPDYQVSGNFPIALLLGGKPWSKGEIAPNPLEVSEPMELGERTSIDSGGGAVIIGDVRIDESGEFIGRDQIVKGDDIIVGDISESNGVAIGRSARAIVLEGISSTESPSDDWEMREKPQMDKLIEDTDSVDEVFPSLGGGPSEIKEEEHVEEPYPQRRVVNTGFSDRKNPDEKNIKQLPLRAGGKYFFWLEIGPPLRESMEETPSDIPSVPTKARLTVVIFGAKDNIEITYGADIGELEVQPDGSVIVISQPMKESLPNSRHLKRRLFFPVFMPHKNGTYHMRCNIYYRQMLLQSRIINARVRQQPRRILSDEKSRHSVLDYTLSHTLNPSHITHLDEHKISILLNQNNDGTHSFHFYGKDGKQKFKQDDVRFGEGELQNMIDQMRGRLRIASWGNKEKWLEGLSYRYSDRKCDIDRLKSDLFNMAQWGYEFYVTIRNRLANSEEVKKFEKILSKPGTIQLAMKESPRYILPAALIYDYPIKVGPYNFSLCSTFEHALNNSNRLDDIDCFQGNCPSRGKDLSICPSGFWGFRHYLGMPLSLKTAPDIPHQIKRQLDLRMTVVVATDMSFLSKHMNEVRELQPNIDWNYSDDQENVFDTLKDFPHIVYFYCHGGLSESDMPFLQIGSKENPGYIYRSNFALKEVVWEKPRPLVFINGCHTAAVEPLKALEFISPLVTICHSAGVIGTEITIFEELATVFAEEFFRIFLTGIPIGEAIRSARLKLLQECNPLGLVYIPFVMAGLRLVP